MPEAFNLITKPLGELLEEAGLITEGQLEVVLVEQNIYSHLKIGEIIALHGWLKQETADFFAERMRQLIKEKNSYLKIGKFFNQAALLSEKDIEDILNEQKLTGVKFGSIAVMKGLLKEQTLDFFLKYFAIEINRDTDFQYKDETTIIRKRLSLSTKMAAEQDKKLTLILCQYYERAVYYFNKSNSVSNKSEKVKCLQGFLRYYDKIEQLQMNNDSSAIKLTYHKQEHLDKILLWVLSELERTF